MRPILRDIGNIYIPPTIKTRWIRARDTLLRNDREVEVFVAKKGGGGKELISKVPSFGYSRIDDLIRPTGTRMRCSVTIDGLPRLLPWWAVFTALRVLL